MKRRATIPEELTGFIADKCMKYTDEQIAGLLQEKYGITATASCVKAYRHRHDIYCGKYTRKAKVDEFISSPASELIAWFCPYMTDAELSRLLEDKLGEHKTAEQIKRWRRYRHVHSGRTGQFGKERCPAKYAKKGVHRSPDTEWKKGHRPHNAANVGDVKIRSDGYCMIKTRAGSGGWKLKARMDYELKHGKLAPDEVLYRLDGDSSNDSSENVRIIKRSTMAKIRTQALKNEPEYMNAVISMTELVEKVKGV